MEEVKKKKVKFYWKAMREGSSKVDALSFCVIFACNSLHRVQQEFVREELD